jgi:hypothetical protein
MIMLICAVLLSQAQQPRARMSQPLQYMPGSGDYFHPIINLYVGIRANISSLQGSPAQANR